MSSSAVSQAPPSQSPDSQRPPSTSSTLYLVTFLATLFLLLFVSCAIVLRSYILRRRYQRRLDEAMAAGMLLAPRTQGSKRKRFGAKPRLYDTWLAPTDGGGVTWSQLMPLSAQPVFVKRKYKEVPTSKSAGGASPAITTNRDGGAANVADTEEILDSNDVDTPNATQDQPSSTPITARLRNLLFRPNRQQQQQQVPRRIPATTTTTRTETQTLYVNEADAAPDAILVEALTPIIPNTTIPSPPLPPGSSFSPSPAAPQPTTPATRPGPTATTPSSTATYRVRIEMLQVSVLIAMPSQSRSAGKKAKAMAIYDDDDDPEDVLDDEEEDDDEEELPELVFGVSRINYKQNHTQTQGQTQQQQHRSGTEGRCVTCGGTVGTGGHPESDQAEDPHVHGELAPGSPSVVEFGEALRRRQPQVQFLEPVERLQEQERDRDSNTNPHTHTQVSNTNTNGVPEEVL